MKEIVKDKLYLVRGKLYKIVEITSYSFSIINTDSNCIIYTKKYDFLIKEEQEKAIQNCVDVLKKLEVK